MPNTNSKTKYFSAKRIATLSALTAMGLIMFMVESLFPPLILPGAKMGLSNIFSMLTLFVLGPVDAFVLVIIRTTLGSVFTGNMSTLMYSMSAGIVSVIVSSLLVEFAYPRISIVAISIVSAVMHNVTQNVVFCLVSNTPEMFAYLPWLALLGVLAGIIVGFAVWFILRMIPLKTFAAMLDAELTAPESAPQQDNTPTETTSQCEQIGEETAQKQEPSETENCAQAERSGESADCANADAPSGSEPSER